MDGRDQPDTNVVRIRRRGDPSEAERRRLASTIFAEPDDVATFSRGNLVPPRPDARDANEELAPSSDPFFDRLPAESKTDGTPRTDLPDHESADAYFDRLATQSPAEMSTSGAPTPAASPMPGSALLPADLAQTEPAPWSPAQATSSRPPWLSDCGPPLRRSRLAWRLSTATLGAVAALVAGIAVIGESGSPGSEQQQSQREASASSLEPLKPGVLAASANPFGATALVHRPVTRVRRPHPSDSGRPRNHRAWHADLSSRADQRQSSRGGGKVHAGPTYVGERRSDPQHPKQLSNRVDDTCRTASRADAPHELVELRLGSSSGSASPSRATLRSLVTGAGTCGCQ